MAQLLFEDLAHAFRIFSYPEVAAEAEPKRQASEGNALFGLGAPPFGRMAHTLPSPLQTGEEMADASS